MISLKSCNTPLLHSVLMIMEFRARRKLVNRVGDSRMISIPPYFIENMNAFDVNEVILTAPDRNHIVLELVRGDQNEN